MLYIYAFIYFRLGVVATPMAGRFLAAECQEG